MKSYDVVIPIAAKDYAIIKYCINGIKNFCIGVNNIYIVSEDNLKIDNTTWIDEKTYPFTKNSIKGFQTNPNAIETFDLIDVLHIS